MWFVMRSIYLGYEGDSLRNKKVIIKLFYCTNILDTDSRASKIALYKLCIVELKMRLLILEINPNSAGTKDDNPLHQYTLSHRLACMPMERWWCGGLSSLPSASRQCHISGVTDQDIWLANLKFLCKYSQIWKANKYI